MNNDFETKNSAVFCQHGPKDWQITTKGCLANKRLAVKDVFAIAGEKNAAGNPTWFNSSKPALKHASSVEKLLQEGCHFVGFSQTDEMAYSLEGNNIHYGAAENPKVPGHACGGSSMGSAAAVAANLADIGLGTDTGGSIRIPASYCGLFGIRPSHDIIAKDGLIPLASPFDTIGWFSRDLSMLSETANVLLPPQPINKIATLVICEPLLELASTKLQTQLTKTLTLAKGAFKCNRSFSLTNKSILTELADCFRILQGRAIAKQYRDWIKNEQPTFSPTIADRFAMAMKLTAQEEQEALAVQQEWQAIMDKNLDNHSCLFLPTTPSTAPKLGADNNSLRMRILTLSAVAGLSRSAQVHLPLISSAEKHPYGFSLLMKHGNDRSLLSVCQKLTTLLS